MKPWKPDNVERVPAWDTFHVFPLMLPIAVLAFLLAWCRQVLEEETT